MATGPKVFNLERLLDKQCFQPLPEVKVPGVFEVTEEALEQFDLDTLVEKKLYIAAASRAHNVLVHLSDGTNYQEIFRLWYIRLSSLVLAHLWTIAREESRVLGDLGSDSYRKPDLTCIVPWKLRVLVVPLQSKGNNQIGLTRYYLLAREATAEAHKAAESEKKNEVPEISSAKWLERLRNLGLYVAAMLMGMGDYLTAIDHLTNIYEAVLPQVKEDPGQSNEGSDGDRNENNYDTSATKARVELKMFLSLVSSIVGLCYLQIGDTFSARQWFQDLKSTEEDDGTNKKYELYKALCSLADADWSDAANILESILESIHEEEETALDDNAFIEGLENNLALAKLHEGNLGQALEHLEHLVEEGSVNSLILMNLFTLYDLQKAVSTKKKLRTLRTVKENGVQSLGNYDFVNL